MLRVLVLQGIILLAILSLACKAQEESSVPNPTSTEPTVIAPTLTPSLTPVATPLSSETPLDDIREPTEEQFRQVRAIYESLPKPLPSGDNWQIVYEESGPQAGSFIVKIDARHNAEEVIRATEEAQKVFRELGYEPCSLPLAGLFGIEIVANPPQFQGPPPSPYASWEPCK